ncbi:MAG: hypothetical protein ABIO70_06160 [Pseudomonadota bacterium]
MSARRGLAPLWIGVPVLISLALYAPLIPSAGWALDDVVALATHAHHGDWRGEFAHATYAWAGRGEGHIWRPIPAALQQLAALAAGRASPVFRGLNLAVHLLNVLLVAGLARRIGAAWGGAALLATLLAVHPGSPEVVCWSSDLYDLCLTSALLGATWIALSPRGPWARGLGLGAMLLVALLCKETALAFVPLAVALPALLDPPAPAHVRGWAGRVLPGLVAGALGAGIYLGLHARVSGEGYGAALGAASHGEQLAAWLGQVGRLVYVPAQAPSAHLFDPGDHLASAVGVLTLGSFGLGAWLLRGRPRAARCILAAGLAWAVLLAPAGAGIPLTRVDPLRYAYPALALCLALLAGALPAEVRRRRIWAGIGAVLALVFGMRAQGRAAAWQDDVSLFTAELVREPDNPYARGCLGHALLGRGDVDEGLDLWSWAVAHIPPGVRVFDLPTERFNLAQAAFLNARPALALAQVEALHAEAQAAGRSAPGLSWCLRADALDALGRHEEASEVEGLCFP